MIGPLGVMHGAFYLIRSADWENAVIVFARGSVNTSSEVVRAIVSNGFDMVYDAAHNPRVQHIVTNATRQLVVASMTTPHFMSWVTRSGVRIAFNATQEAWHWYVTAPRRITFFLLGDPNDDERFEEIDSEELPTSVQGSTNPATEMQMVPYHQSTMGGDAAPSKRKRALEEDDRALPQKKKKDLKHREEGEKEKHRRECDARCKEQDKVDHPSKRIRLEEEGDGELGSESKTGPDGTPLYKCTGVTGQGLPCSRWSRRAAGIPPVYHCCKKHEEQWNNRHEVYVEEGP